MNVDFNLFSDKFCVDLMEYNLKAMLELKKIPGKEKEAVDGLAVELSETERNALNLNFPRGSRGSRGSRGGYFPVVNPTFDWPALDHMVTEFHSHQLICLTLTHFADFSSFLLTVMK